MKKIIYSSALFLALSSFAQEKQIVFDNLFEYNLESNNPEKNDNRDLKIKYYFSSIKNISFFEINFLGSKPENIIIKDGKSIKIDAIGFDNILYVVSLNYYYYSMQNTNELLNAKMKLEPMNKKGSFAGISCDFYALKFDNSTETNFNDENICFCIDTNNKVKNLKALLPNSNLDGLILSYGRIDFPDEMISLNSIKKVDIKVAFDFDAEYKKVEDGYTAYLAENLASEVDDVVNVAEAVTDDYDSYYSNYYEDPLCNNYTYFDELSVQSREFAYSFKDLGCSLKNIDSDYDGNADLTREQAILIFKKQTQAIIKQAKKEKILNKSDSKALTESFNKLFKDASAFVLKKEADTTNYTAEYISDDYTDTALQDYSDFRKYESDYNKIDVQTISLAAESQYDDSMKNYMPDYCSNLKQGIPNFKNQVLKTHVYNLVGQICDLYLYQNGGYVDYFGTIDSMRKSLLEIENLRAELSKSDAKMLNEYLNSLD